MSFQLNRTNGRTLKIRMGEWDASSSTEPIAAQEFNVARIFIHPQFTAANLRNDIAILRLASTVPLGQVPTITTACIPSTVVSSIRCWVAGWGRNDFTNNGAYQAIQKEVDVPLIDQNTCQNQLRATRLGQNFQLDFNSFVCAGGEAGKDACTGKFYITTSKNVIDPSHLTFPPFRRRWVTVDVSNRIKLVRRWIGGLGNWMRCCKRSWCLREYCKLCELDSSNHTFVI